MAVDADESADTRRGGDYASAALVNLIRGSLRRRGIMLPEAFAARAQGPLIPLGFKRDLLDWIASEHGLGLVAAIGADLRHAPFDPVLHMLTRASTGRQMIERWCRLERYFHSRHRIHVEAATGNEATLVHVSQAHHPPVAAEDLLIAGVMEGLLLAQGCEGVELWLLQNDGKAVHPTELAKACPRALEPAISTYRWRLTWLSEPQPRNTSGEAAEPTPVGQFGSRPSRLARRLAAILAEDPGQIWTLSQAADLLGQTPRTLQRRLAADGVSFSRIVAESRIREACRLLNATNTPLSLIGLLAGYTDAPHFAREFRRNVGLTPSAYRKAAGP